MTPMERAERVHARYEEMMENDPYGDGSPRTGLINLIAGEIERAVLDERIFTAEHLGGYLTDMGRRARELAELLQERAKS